MEQGEGQVAGARIVGISGKPIRGDAERCANECQRAAKKGGNPVGFLTGLGEMLDGKHGRGTEPGEKEAR